MILEVLLLEYTYYTSMYCNININFNYCLINKNVMTK